ncbi:hypothetical protein GCM10010844_43980 [Deinococcus radiotolerans]|uniref:Transposase n=1 Tax=Deinococcus radiotolerans TaxID=1309407 RepID=A0ABQ2FRM9_9DEIO|nr:hypothetical protein GCM10010844_43980 [Deinococcus radiotolerans]
MGVKASVPEPFRLSKRSRPRLREHIVMLIRVTLNHTGREHCGSGTKGALTVSVEEAKGLAPH